MSQKMEPNILFLGACSLVGGIESSTMTTLKSRVSGFMADMK